jgi:low affinity Fe/Cu permease
MILSMGKRKETASIGGKFETMSTVVTRWTGTTAAFGTALSVIVIWAILGPVFHFSDTWQLVSCGSLKSTTASSRSSPRKRAS